jgi:tRNA dimethylallyltransferase
MTQKKLFGLPKIITIVGPNASGKSSLGIELAKIFNGEIISADSRQLYRGFDLCCGKITAEESKIIPHHLLDIKDIGESFSVFDYQKLVYSLIPQILSRGKIPFIVGGTGLYVNSIVYGYNFREDSADIELRDKLEKLSLNELQEMLTPEGKAFLALNCSDFHNKRRVIRTIVKTTLGESLNYENNAKYEALQLGVLRTKEQLYERIAERLTQRIEQGMIDEVKTYLDNGGSQEHLYNLGLEYRYILWYVTGKFKTIDEFKTELERAIRRFAKRQMTWFRRDKTINWIDMNEDALEQSRSLISEFLK